MSDEAVSRGFNIGGHIIAVDPRTGKCENAAKPYSKSEWRQIAKQHTVTIVHADGSKTVATIAGATHSELRDADFVYSVAMGGEIKHRLSNEQWHEYIMRLASKYPDKVVQPDCSNSADISPRSGPRVVVAVSMRQSP